MIPWSQNHALKELINVLDWWYWWMFLRGNLGPTVFFGVKFRQRILELPPLQRLLFFLKKSPIKQSVFLLLRIWLNFRPEKNDFDLDKGFCMGKMAQISQISISKNFKSSESYDNFQKVVKNIEEFWVFLLSYRLCSQIWLHHKIVKRNPAWHAIKLNNAALPVHINRIFSLSWVLSFYNVWQGFII
jgi:hypothetical protein